MYRNKTSTWQILSGIRLFLGAYALIPLFFLIFNILQMPYSWREILTPFAIVGCLFWLGIFAGLFFITKQNVNVAFLRLVWIQGGYVIFTIVNYWSNFNAEMFEYFIQQANPLILLLEISPLLVFGILLGGHSLAKSYAKPIEKPIQG